MWEARRASRNVGSKLTSINRLLGLLRLDTGVVRISGLGFEASRRAVFVQVATTVHGLLEGVAFPSEDVVSMGSSATVGCGRLTASLQVRTRYLSRYSRKRFATYPMPILYWKGLDPSVGQMLRSFWNIVTFHMSSYMICGSLTG